jgi:16S rRNA (cytidine1402-2'-O)-methyltransferase
MSGKLYIVATPIGNLGDMTMRAIETLRTVDRIVAEDTRVTAKLLQRYDIKKPMVSLRARSARAQFEKVAQLVADGETLAYVTDAGTPGISDPGPLLVSMVRDLCGEAAILAIPGASALTAALSVAGVPTDEFTFIGFLPHKKGRQKQLDGLMKEKRLIVMYESPHRIKKLLSELEARVPERTVIIGHELTKMHERTVVGTPHELLGRLGQDIPERGEFVVMVTPDTLR